MTVARAVRFGRIGSSDPVIAAEHSSMTQETESLERMSARMWLLSLGLLAAAAVLMVAAYNDFPNIDCNAVPRPGRHRPLAAGDYLVLASIVCALGGAALFTIGQWRAGHPVRGLILGLIPVPVDLAFAFVWVIVVGYSTFHCS
jgi:hypothetical protein